MYMTDEQLRLAVKDGCIPKTEEHSYDDYWLYMCTMDAITTRKPERMRKNGMEMLWSKVRQIANPELRAHAFGEFRKLSEKVKACES